MATFKVTRKQIMAARHVDCTWTEEVLSGNIERRFPTGGRPIALDRGLARREIPSPDGTTAVRFDIVYESFDERWESRSWDCSEGDQLRIASLVSGSGFVSR